MTLQFKDFSPDIEYDVFSKQPNVGRYKNMLNDVNAWIKDNNIKVINVETIVIPNPPLQDPHPPAATTTNSWGRILFVQIIRVWYQEQD